MTNSKSQNGFSGRSSDQITEKKSSLMKPFYVILAIPIFISVILHYIVSSPPTDFGTGTMFDHIATRYDFINRALALNLDTSWRREMVREVTRHGTLFLRNHGSGSGDDLGQIKILDLATGTADVAILLAKEYQSIASRTSTTAISTHILGVDPSQNMIAVGNQKVSDQNLSNLIRLELGDARNLSHLPSDAFHAATMSFGIRNVPEREDALCEIHRVLLKENPNSAAANPSATGGQLAILEFSEPTAEAGIMGYIARFFIRNIVPVVGAVLSGAPKEYMHLQNSIKEFPSPSEFVSLMEGLDCHVENGQGQMRGTFRVDKLRHMNFGSVQLYLATPVLTAK